jgi:hypothetical protein
VLIALKKANKDEKVRNDLAALSEMSRIRIRNTSGVFEVSLVKVCIGPVYIIFPCLNTALYRSTMSAGPWKFCGTADRRGNSDGAALCGVQTDRRREVNPPQKVGVRTY